MVIALVGPTAIRDLAIVGLGTVMSNVELAPLSLRLFGSPMGSTVVSTVVACVTVAVFAIVEPSITALVRTAVNVNVREAPASTRVPGLAVKVTVFVPGLYANVKPDGVVPA